MKTSIYVSVVFAILLAGCSGPPSNPRSFSDELHDAAREGDLREIRSLIELGADVNAREDGETPLNLAIRNRQIEAAEELLLRGADPNRRTKGSSPLHLAAEFGSIEIARLLLDHGANHEVRNGKSQTPLELAQEKGETQFMFWLQDEIQKRKRTF